MGKYLHFISSLVSLWERKRKDIHAKPQGAWHIRLPVCTVEHEHAGEAAEEHPVRIGAKLHSYAGAQHDKHYRREREIDGHLSFTSRGKHNWSKNNPGNYLWRESHNRGQTAPLEVSCYWYVLPASHQWRPMTGRQRGPQHTRDTPTKEPKTKRVNMTSEFSKVKYCIPYEFHRIKQMTSVTRASCFGLAKFKEAKHILNWTFETLKG